MGLLSSAHLLARWCRKPGPVHTLTQLQEPPLCHQGHQGVIHRCCN